MDVSAINSTASSNTAASKNAADTQDRFLKLLVAQMNNQDPLNPMDNAQVTSQMAQIQQVTALSTLDSSVKNLGLQLGQMQAMQSISLVGREVAVPSDKVRVVDGRIESSYELDGAAKNVKLEILGSGGNVIDTVQLGAQGSGRQTFSWTAGAMAAEGADLKYRITATNGTKTVDATLYSFDKVTAVYSEDSRLKLALERLGAVDYASVASVN